GRAPRIRGRDRAHVLQPAHGLARARDAALPAEASRAAAGAALKRPWRRFGTKDSRRAAGTAIGWSRKAGGLGPDVLARVRPIGPRHEGARADSGAVRRASGRLERPAVRRSGGLSPPPRRAGRRAR